MRLYEYRISNNGKVTFEEHDNFEEKPKTYRRKNRYPYTINKSEIGVVDTGFFSPVLWMLERDDAKAKLLFAEHYHSQIKNAKQEYEEKCQKYQKIIDQLN